MLNSNLLQNSALVVFIMENVDS